MRRQGQPHDGDRSYSRKHGRTRQTRKPTTPQSRAISSSYGNPGYRRPLFQREGRGAGLSDPLGALGTVRPIFITAAALKRLAAKFDLKAVSGAR